MKRISRLPVWWQLFIGLACCFLFSLIVICASFFIDIKEAEKNNWSYLHRMNSQWELEIEKEYEDDLGMEFENGLMDDYRSCRNKCMFCFIDQLPKGMRDTLYFKDDDSRL